MVRGGEWSAGGKKGLRGKNEKGERQKEENYIKKGEKGPKNASFRDINSNRSPAANLFVGEKNLISKEGGGEMIRMHNIYPCNQLFIKVLREKT